MAAFPGGGNTLQFPNLPGNTNYGANNSPQLGGVTTSDWRLFFGDPKGPIDTSALGPFKRENFALPVCALRKRTKRACTHSASLLTSHACDAYRMRTRAACHT